MLSSLFRTVWRRRIEHILRRKRCWFGFLVILVIVNGLRNELFLRNELPKAIKSGERRPEEQVKVNEHTDEEACQIPKLDPFHDTIKHLSNPEPTLDCSTSTFGLFQYPLIFGTDLKSNLIIVYEDPAKYGYEDCCYLPFYGHGDLSRSYSLNCFPITEKSVRIPKQYEFIAIYCHRSISWIIPNIVNWILNNQRTLVDMLHFVHSDLPKNYHQGAAQSMHVVSDKVPNVLILGLDAVSHPNFIRMMPRSFQYLINNLSAIKMNGLGILGKNTFPNLVPLLIGQTVAEINAYKGCWPNKDSYFDECDFIWKAYSKKGYVTSYAEDHTHIAAFTLFKNGFISQPTDYYLNPFTTALWENLRHAGNGSDKWNCKVCYGPRLGFSILLENIKMVVLSLGLRPFFQFTWTTSLSHDNLNYAGAGDSLLLDLLQWLNSKGFLENTIFILMSDHGIRGTEIMEIEQIRLEHQLPFLYIVFPDWFKRKFSRAVKNVESNVDKLTTPMDLHEMLKDILHLRNIDDQRLESRQKELDSADNLPLGISLFLSLPDISNRRCKEAGISLIYCFCYNPVPIDVSRSEVITATKVALQWINDKLSAFRECAKLSLDKIETAGLRSVEEHGTKNSTLSSIQLTFRTIPSNGLFQANLVQGGDKEWILSGEILRLNRYGDQSKCVNDLSMKSFCYCSSYLF